MIYVDEADWPWRGMLWCHMVADSLEELHEFAQRLGLKREWFQEPPKTKYPHYDTIKSKREKALKMGAIPCDRRTLIAKAKQLREEHRRLTCPETDSVSPQQDASGIKP